MPPLNPLIAAGLIQAGGAIASGIGAGRRQKRARQWALDDWDRVNKYNHPQAQMQRLQEAKLNPALIYGKGGGAANTAGSVGQTSLDTTAGEEIGQGVGAAATNMFDHKVKVAQAKDLEQSAHKKTAEILNLGVKTEQDKENLQLTKTHAHNLMYEDWIQKGEQTALIQEQIQDRRKHRPLETRQKEIQNQISAIELKLRKHGLTPNSPAYLKVMVLNKAEMNILLKYLK